MRELKRTLEDGDIGGLSPGTFQEDLALALLLMNGEVILADDRLCVNCSDVFVWGSSDEESLPLDEFEPVYRIWRERPWGAQIWCLIRRKQMPQEPVEQAMRKAGW